MQTGMNPDLKKPVGHIALSYSAVDAPKLTDEKMIQLAQEYMREMKITDTQYIIVRHQDREHPHVHIVFNRIDNNGKTISDRNDMYRNEQVCKKLKAKHGLYFAGGKEQVKQHRLKEPDKSKYEIYHAVKNEIGKSRNWQQLQERLAEKGITIRFKYTGQTSEIQGVSFSKGEYTFKGSEIDRSFSFSKLDKCFGDVGQTTAGSNKQAVLLHADGVLTESRSDIIRSFCMQTGMNPDLKKPVGHIALSYSAVDAPKLTDGKMIQLAQEYMREMKITDTQYIIVRHQDREHPHVHIVFNRIDNNGKSISDRNDMYRNEQVCKKLKAKHGLYFAKGKEQVKQHRLKEPDKSKYEIYTAVKNEIGKSRNWQQLQQRLAEMGIAIQFKYKGQTSEIQGISISKGEYTFKGSEIDRSFSFSKLDKCFGDAGMNVAESQRQTTFAPVREQAPAPSKADSPLITGSLGLFSASSPPVDEEPNFNLRKKKKKKKQLKL